MEELRKIKPIPPIPAVEGFLRLLPSKELHHNHRHNIVRSLGFFNNDRKYLGELTSKYFKSSDDNTEKGLHSYIERNYHNSAEKQLEIGLTVTHLYKNLPRFIGNYFYFIYQEFTSNEKEQKKSISHAERIVGFIKHRIITQSCLNEYYNDLSHLEMPWLDSWRDQLLGIRYSGLGRLTLYSGAGKKPAGYAVLIDPDYIITSKNFFLPERSGLWRFEIGDAARTVHVHVVNNQVEAATVRDSNNMLIYLRLLGEWPPLMEGYLARTKDCEPQHKKDYGTTVYLSAVTGQPVPYERTLDLPERLHPVFSYIEALKKQHTLAGMENEPPEGYAFVGAEYKQGKSIKELPATQLRDEISTMQR